MHQIADLIADLLKASKAHIVDKTGKPSKAKVDIDSIVLKRVQEEVTMLLSKFVLYPELTDLALAEQVLT